MSSAVDGPGDDVFRSTGELPKRDLLRSLVREADARYRAKRDGAVSGTGTLVPLDRKGNGVTGQLVGRRARDV